MEDTKFKNTEGLPSIEENGRPISFSSDHNDANNDIALGNSTEIEEPSAYGSASSFDSPSVSLNGDIILTDARSTASLKTNSNIHHTRKVSDASFSLLTPTISTSNYNNSSVSLGINNLSATSVSPLGQNSIYELIENAQYRSKATSTGYLTTMSSPSQINIRGPTTRDIPAIKLSKITKVKDQQFQPYLNTVSDSFKQFESHKTLTKSTLEAYMAQLNREDRRKGLSQNAKTRKREITSSINSSTMTGGSTNETATFLADNINHPKHKYTKMEDTFGMDALDSAELTSNSLEKVPEIFFSNDFRLDDPRVFNEVIGNKKILQETIDYNGEGEQKSVVDNNVLQERFSSYLDIIEIHLIHEISKSSGSFFSALGDLRKISESSNKLTEKLNTIDHKLSSLGDEKVFPMIDILQMVRKRNNIARLEQSLLQLSTIMHQADMAESSYFNANYEKVLEITEAVYALIKGDKTNKIVFELTKSWNYDLINMDSLKALFPLKRLLSNLISDTGKSFAKLFCDYLIDDLRRVYENSSITEVTERMAGSLNHDGGNTFRKKTSGTKGNYQKVDSDFKNGLEKYIRGLIRCGEITSAYRTYEDHFLTEMKTIIRSFLSPEKMENIGNSGTSISGLSGDSRTTTSKLQRGHSLGAMIRALTPKEFEDMLLGIYTQISEALRRLTIHQKLLLEIALDSISDITVGNTSNELQPDSIVQLDITDAITSAIEISQRRMAKIMNARELQNSCVTLDYFLRLYSLNTMFLGECELISGGRLVNPVLQDIIRVQFQKFYSQYHHASMKILSGKVEKEIWRECSLPKYLQILTNQEVSAGKDDFDEYVWMGPMNLEFGNADDKNDNNTDGASSEGRKTLTIGEESFIVPNVVGSILEMLQHYEIIKMQFHYVDCGCIIELLKLLNLKIHQSVLGAQATRTAGLRNITSRHLAVTSQLLGFLSELIPHIRSLFERLSKADTVSSLVGKFNDVQKMLISHRTEIFNKLISIMVDRLVAEKSDIQQINWTHPLPMQKVHYYMEGLVSKTLTIARILQRYLPEDQYTHILSQIFDKYKNVLTDIYSGIRLKDSVEKAVIMRDIDYFREKLADVSGYSNSGQIIWENVNAMITEEDGHVIQPDHLPKSDAIGISSSVKKSVDQPSTKLDEKSLEKVSGKEDTNSKIEKEAKFVRTEVMVETKSKDESKDEANESSYSDNSSQKVMSSDENHKPVNEDAELKNSLNAHNKEENEIKEEKMHKEDATEKDEKTPEHRKDGVRGEGNNLSQVLTTSETSTRNTEKDILSTEGQTEFKKHIQEKEDNGLVNADINTEALEHNARKDDEQDNTRSDTQSNLYEDKADVQKKQVKEGTQKDHPEKDNAENILKTQAYKKSSATGQNHIDGIGLDAKHPDKILSTNTDDNGNANLEKKEENEEDTPPLNNENSNTGGRKKTNGKKNRKARRGNGGRRKKNK
ncbi:hypothetical protein BRETT_002667 [Brettanomyces bruxellensis]|uniref:Vacuolar protein sorting-associated protein 54 C-terminal domain-containing protein n=1 Tax=Dekkera bruxellensis TaxID=5007 RepID=A0A871R6X7_DEKBR|nr:uncharacterized protein BRETT_002667 [Brettanomyces bruxellensis]QOU22487.1 hypothetical protein BRETT_002667 [Brettanomyces bruxellensis]